MRLSQPTTSFALVGLYATASYAQESAAGIDFWADSSCGEDLMGDDTRSVTFGVYRDAVIDEEGEGYCSSGFVNLGSGDNPWPKDDTGDYIVYVDKSSIGDGCKFMLFEASKQEDSTPIDCKTAYTTITPGKGCPETHINGDFGYGYCCGKGCDMPKVVDQLQPSTKRSIDSTSRNVQAEKRRARKSVEHKREPAFGMTKKRDECKFKSDSAEPRTTYGQQKRVTQVTSCNSSDGCDINVEFSYSQMESESFGGGASIGGELFKAIGLEVNFQGEWSESEEQRLSMSTTFNVPEGSGGWVTFEPKLQCAKGEFEGDCDDWDSGVEGEACFVETVAGGAPDGNLAFVAEL